MTGEVIKSFLVGLGFGVDDKDLAKFNKAIQSASLRVAALFGTVNAAAAGIVAGISEISEGFEKMGYEYRIISPAINKALILRRELLKAYSAAGINITKVVQQSVKLNLSLTKTKFAFEAIYRSVGARFFELLTKQSDIFRKKLYENMPKIQNALERMVKFIFKALEATTTLGIRLWSILTRVYDFFVMLDKATDGWSTVILSVIAAWRLLNLSFIATPLGLIITGLVAILALFDDFKTWEEGGASLFDWKPAIPVINAIGEALGHLKKAWQSIVDVVLNVVLAVYQLLHADMDGFFESVNRWAESLVGVFSHLWDSLKGLKNFFTGNTAVNLQNNPSGVSPVSPVSSSTQNSSQTNQNVHQQTNISVVGSADAASTGRAVSSEQGRVNFDFVKNLKGATR